MVNSTLLYYGARLLRDDSVRSKLLGTVKRACGVSYLLEMLNTAGKIRIRFNHLEEEVWILMGVTRKNQISVLQCR